MNRIFAVSLVTLAMLTGCADSPENPPVEVDDVAEVEPTESSTSSASEDPLPKVEVNPPAPALDTSIYAALDAECGTALSNGAEVAGEGTNASVNALFIGMKSIDLQKLECILDATQTTVTVGDLESGVENPVFSTSDAGAWAIQGSISPLGDDGMIAVNLFFLPAS